MSEAREVCKQEENSYWIVAVKVYMQIAALKQRIDMIDSARKCLLYFPESFSDSVVFYNRFCDKLNGRINDPHILLDLANINKTLWSNPDFLCQLASVYEKQCSRTAYMDRTKGHMIKPDLDSAYNYYYRAFNLDNKNIAILDSCDSINKELANLYENDSIQKKRLKSNRLKMDSIRRAVVNMTVSSSGSKQH
jgi:hypothetical protein